MTPANVRLGNIFIDSLTKLFLAVVEINEKKIVFDIRPAADIKELPKGWQAEPVGLSEEMLKRLGCKMKKEDHFMWRTPGHTLFTFRKADNTVAIMAFGKLLEIQTVHEFQNAVAITDEELKLL